MSSFAEKVDKGTTMQIMWDGFAEAVIPHLKQGDVRYDEMKSAFFAGALCLFNWFMVQMDDTGNPDDVTDADMDRVSKMDDELHAYFASIPRSSTH